MKISTIIQNIIVVAVVLLLVGCSKNEKKKDEPSNTFYTEHDYEICDKYINEVLDEVEEYSIKDYESTVNRQEAVKKVRQKAETWKKEGIITQIKSTDYQVILTFKSGIVYVFYPMAEDVSGTGNDISIYSLQVAKKEFADRNYETEVADFNATDGVAERLANKSSNYKWKYNLDDQEVTLKTICEFGADEFILWSGHGAYIEDEGCCLVLNETYKDNYYTD